MGGGRAPTVFLATSMGPVARAIDAARSRRRAMLIFGDDPQFCASLQCVLSECRVGEDES